MNFQMKNWLHWQDRKELLYRLNLKSLIESRAAANSPKAFRNQLILPNGNSVQLKEAIQPWQRTDFRALDSAWRCLAGKKRSCKFRRAYLERPRGHSKTSDMAIQVAWILIHAPNKIQGLAAAADREQADLLHSAVKNLAQANSEICEPLQFRQHAVINRETGSRLDIISSDVRSSWGALPDFVICDELCHWEKPELWYSLSSSAAKKETCVLVVLTNAGIGNGWQWDVRETARNSDNWYFSSLDGVHAPWISKQQIAEQKEILPDTIFNRLWLNEWQQAEGGFVTLTEADACCDPQRQPQDQSQPNRNYVAAIDYAEKHDDTVGVVVHRENNCVVVDRMDVFRPKPGNPVLISWVDDWIKRISEKFTPITFIVDEYQLLGTIQKYEGLYDIRRFQFQGGKGNHALAINLRKLLIHRELAWYPDCGKIIDSTHRDDLATELASLRYVHNSNGRCRITHFQDGIHHDDRAFALGAACLQLTTGSAQPEWLEMTAPSFSGGFNL